MFALPPPGTGLTPSSETPMMAAFPAMEDTLLSEATASSYVSVRATGGRDAFPVDMGALTVGTGSELGEGWD